MAGEAGIALGRDGFQEVLVLAGMNPVTGRAVAGNICVGTMGGDSLRIGCEKTERQEEHGQ